MEKWKGGHVFKIDCCIQASEICIDTLDLPLSVQKFQFFTEITEFLDF